MAKKREPEFIGGFQSVGGTVPEVSKPEMPAVQKSAGLTASEKRARAKLIRELAARQTETLKLYKPLPHQLPFHLSSAQERLCFGSNQSGKTTAAAVELAWIVTNQHPYLKYPKHGDAFVIGRDHAHLAHTILPKLLKPQQTLRRIKDVETGKWRQYDPILDKSRFEESEQMGPLIPERMIKNIAWENRGQGVPQSIEMKNGWKITFFTSNGKPPNGANIDYAWSDEEVGDEWPKELAPRLMARRGKITWSATPQVGGAELLMMHERCQSQLALPREERSSEEFFMLLSDNTHIDQYEKEKLAEKYKHDPDSYRVRIQGQFLILGGLIYPQWSNTKHVIEPFNIPNTWARYMCVDPGHTVCACLFAAVPPPDDMQHGGHVYIYDELYIRECDPTKFAEAVKRKVEGQQFHAFLIDDCGSRRTDGAVGISMRQAYSDALKARGIASKSTGSNFLIGSSDVKAGLMQVREWIGTIVHHKELGDRPKLQVFNTCSNLMFEIKVYYKRRDPRGGWTDEPNQKNNHACDCFDGETEVLTDKGWKRFDDLLQDDLVASVGLTEKTIRYERPTEYIKRWHDGQMVKMKSGSVDLLVTPNHRMVVTDQSSRGNSSDVWSIVEAKNIKKSSLIPAYAHWSGDDETPVRIPRVPNCRTEERVVNRIDFAELCGWFVAEGCCAKRSKSAKGRGFQVNISQSKFNGRESLESLFKKLPWKWHSKAGEGYATSDAALWTFLSETCHIDGDSRGCLRKIVPDWIRFSGRETIAAFLRGYIAGDGWKSGGTFAMATTSRALADGLQEIIFKSGANASIRVRSADSINAAAKKGSRQIVAKNDQYWLHISNRKHRKLHDSSGNPVFKNVDYSGFVYCVTVPSGCIIVRRNGRTPVVVGNCLRYLAMHGCHYVKPDIMKKSLWRKWFDSERKKNRGDGFGANLCAGSGS